MHFDVMWDWISGTLNKEVQQLTMVVLGITAFVIWQQLHIARRSLRARAILDTFIILEGHKNEVRELRRTLREEIQHARANGSEFNPLTASEKTQREMDQLAREYDKTGFLMKYGAISPSLVFDFYSRPILDAWYHLQPLIQAERKLRQQSGHLWKFEILATGAALYRQKKHGEHFCLPICAQQRKEWDTWNTEDI